MTTTEDCSNLSTMEPNRLTLFEYMKSMERETKSVISAPYFMLRVDGRAFHTFTRQFAKPFDLEFMDAMDVAAMDLVKEVAGAVAAYVASDEISVLARSFDVAHKEGEPELWFGGDVAKMTTIAAASASVSLSAALGKRALFDGRVFTIPEDDIARYFFWRQRDTIKNSVTMAAECQFNRKSLHGKTTDERIQMLAEAGAPWDALPAGFRYGRFLRPERRDTEQRPNSLVWDTLVAPRFQPQESAALLKELRALRND